jgi:hypothetical protein
VVPDAVVKLADPDTIGGEELFAALHADGAEAEAGVEAGTVAGAGAGTGTGAEAGAVADTESSEDLEFDEESGAGDDSSAASVWLPLPTVPNFARLNLPHFSSIVMKVVMVMMVVMVIVVVVVVLVVMVLMMVVVVVVVIMVTVVVTPNTRFRF